MSIQVLVAEPNDILRARLCDLVSEDPAVTGIHEAMNGASLTRQILSLHIDLTIINQYLVTDMAIFPRGHLIILATRPDMATLKRAYLYGARGYLSMQVPTELLRSLLQPDQQRFIFDPLFIPWVMEYLFRSPLASIKEDLLTPREREIVSLLRKGCSRHKIANDLSISESTLKTHLKNIARKREIEPFAHLESQILGGKRQVSFRESELEQRA